MHNATVQIVVGAALVVIAGGFVAYGVRRFRGASAHSTAPLTGWEHYLNFGMASRSMGSARRVEYMAGAGAIIGGVLAVLVGAGILAVGIGAS